MTDGFLRGGGVMESDAEIIKAVLSGNQAAYAGLVQRYEGTVRAVATQILEDLHAAEDVAQDAFVKAYERLDSLRNGAAFRPWLLQIARRRALDVLRKKGDSVPLGEDDLSPAPSPEHNARLNEESRLLLDAIMNLPARARDVIMLRYFDGQPVATISENTGRSVGTVTKQLTRARTRLRTMLEEHKL